MPLSVEQDDQGALWIVQTVDFSSESRKIASLRDRESALIFNQELARSMAFAKAAGEMGI